MLLKYPQYQKYVNHKHSVIITKKKNHLSFIS